MKDLLKLLFSCTAVLAVLFSCKNEVATTIGALPGSTLFVPVLLEPDTTKLVISDYTLQDSLSFEAPSGLQLAVEHGQILLTGQLESATGILKIKRKNKQAHVLLKRSDKQRITFEYKGKHKKPALKGEFNAWNSSKGTFSANNKISFKLSPGTYQYLLVEGGNEIRDPFNKDSIENGVGGWNSLLKVVDPNPAKAPQIEAQNSTYNLVVRSDAPMQSVVVFYNNIAIVAQELSGKETTFNLSKKLWETMPDSGHLRIYTTSNNKLSNELMFPIHSGKVVDNANSLDRTNKHNNTLYFMMVDRFFNGNKNNDKPLNLPSVHPRADYHGGDLRGITSQLEQGYFTELGINTIWISPITQNPEGPFGYYPDPGTKFSAYHGYWPISSTRVDYRFGTNEELEEMLDGAHKKELNVLLDYVANHVHEQHSIYKNNPDWATDLYLPDGSMNTEKWDEHRLTTWFDTFLPTLDLRKEEVIEPMTDSAIFWLKQFDFDGFRHDATKHIPLKFWRTLTKKVKTQVMEPNNKSIFQIGETYGSKELIASYINSGMLDAQFDFNLYDDAVATFAGNDENFTRLNNGLLSSIKWYGDHHLMGNISGNQDRARFISYADGSVRFDEDAKKAGWTRTIDIQDSVGYKKLALLHAFNYAIPGLPVVYYGDEIGLPGGNDPDNRKMMVFEALSNQQNQLKGKVAQLGKLRNARMELIYGSTQSGIGANNVYWIKRSYLGQSTLIVLNNSSETKSLDLTTLIDATHTRVEFGQTIQNNTLNLEPYSFEYITTN